MTIEHKTFPDSSPIDGMKYDDVYYEYISEDLIFGR
jgi:hypothetical protein